MSSSSDPLQNSFDSYEPKQELESPFLNEEYLADEARIAQWRVPAPGVQLESPFLEAFEEGWRSSEVEEFEDEFVSEFEERWQLGEFEEFGELEDLASPRKEVIYVRGGYKSVPEEHPWQYAHPRIHNPNTILNLFDYELMKHKRWDNWNGSLPPDQLPSSESSIKSVLDLYKYIKSISSGSLEELHFFTHGYSGGPVLTNTRDLSGDLNKRDPNDKDPRIKDFNIPGILGGKDGETFKNAFSPSALVKLWGCTFEQSYRDKVREYFKTKDKKTKEIIRKDYLQAIYQQTYQFALHKAIGIPVYAAPLGWGTDPSLPFGIYGKKALQLVKDKNVSYKKRWPPSKGDRWWQVSPYFSNDGGSVFYKSILGFKLDILNYVAYTEVLVDPAIQPELLAQEIHEFHGEENPNMRSKLLNNKWEEYSELSNQLDYEEFDSEIEEEEETTTGRPENEFKNCSNAQKNEIQKAFERAMKAVRYAETFIGSAYGRPDKMSTKTRQLLNRHFHTTDRDDLREILGKLISIRHAFEKGISFECEKECIITVQGYAYNTQWFGGFGNVHICFDTRPGGGDFSKQSLKSQEVLVIHEVGHRYGGLDDEAYLHEKKYGMLSPKQAINNADSYAGFSVDLYRSGTRLSNKPINELSYDSYVEEFEEDMEDLEYYDEESNWQIEQQTPKPNLHDIPTQEILIHVYFHTIHSKSTNYPEYTVKQFFDWVVGSSPDESRPNRFQLAGAEINLFNNSKTAVSEFKRSLNTPGAIVVYLGHTISSEVSSKKFKTWGLTPSGPLSKKPDITCSELTKILSAAKAKIVVLAGCATSQCVTKKIKGGTVVIVTESGNDRGTNADAWAAAIKALLDELLTGGTIGDAFDAANKIFAKGSSTDSFKMISGDSTLKM
jgi:Lysine-specific metallo-endopeptidase